MKYTHNKQELLGFGTRRLVRIVGGELVAIQSRGQTILISTRIEGITLGAGEEIDEVAGGANDMGMDRIEVGDWAREGQAAGV